MRTHDTGTDIGTDADLDDDLDEFASVIHVLHLIYLAAELDGTTETANPRLGVIADTLVDPKTGTTLHTAARTAALDGLHSWAFVEHARLGYTEWATCGTCAAQLPPALLPYCDHGFGPDDPQDR